MTRIIFRLLSGFAIACALSAASAAGAAPELAHDAPDQYVVQAGDTLWSIAGRFLREPWHWPQLWRTNRTQIRNPHRIHPGQRIVLDRRGPWLELADTVEGEFVRLQPRVHDEALPAAVPAIPIQAIEPFLSQPRIVDAAGLADAAVIVATETSRVLTASGDTVFATGVAAGVNAWQIFRPARALRDPESGEVIAHESDYLGSARVTAHGDPAELQIVSAVEEVGVGDRLLPSASRQPFEQPPHAPAHAVDARIVSIQRGVSETGPLGVVALNRGAGAGLEAGHVLALVRARTSVDLRGEAGRQTWQLPPRRYGLALVFRVFERVSYALVMEADSQVRIGDAARTP